MRSIIASIDVPHAQEDVYDFLDVLANHALFTDHMMRDWELSGPDRGVGAKVHLNSVLGGRTEPVDVEVIVAERPVKNVERNVSARGKRVATGTYTLEALPAGGTRITFEYDRLKVPFAEQLAAPLIARMMRKALQQAMGRLAEQLAERT